jgi:hypothetical protein
MMDRSIIGFDRRLELSWLDEAAAAAARNDTPAMARSTLKTVLEGTVGADELASARANTVGVLMRLWVRVQPQRREHRNRGINLLSRLPPHQHVWVHWGTALAAYPFFYDVASLIGKQLHLQESVSLAVLTRRMAELWGDRSTMKRALQRVVRSMVSWGVLRETSERGTFIGPVSRSTPPPEVAAWLLEAVLRGSGVGSLSLNGANGQTCLFPFQVELSPRDLREQPGVELHREGVDREVLTLR